MITEGHNQQLACLLVDMDSIFDTRLGTIAKFGKEAYATVLMNGYYTRRSDHFAGIDPIKYRELYNDRDPLTLSGSMITHVVSLIKDFVARVNITSASSPVKAIPTVHINTYPYDPPDYVMQTIMKGLKVHIQDKFDISYVRYSPQDLHYDLVKFTYDHLIMYEIGPWLSAQAEDWLRLNRGLPDVTVFFPTLHRGENLKDIPEDIASIADDVNKELAPIINPMQIPIQFFCSAFDPSSIQPSSEAEAPDDSVVGS